jgi:uncharacterized membrane protein
MNARPKIEIGLTTSDKILEIVGWISVIFIWALTILKYPSLPESIPTHFNASGQVDDYGGRGTILFLPVLGTILFGGLTILNKYPHIFNYPVPVTEENAERQYRNAIRLIRYIKLILVLTFLAIEFMTIQTAAGKSTGLATWFLPAMLVVLFVPIAFFIFKAVKLK